jgi:hypothetical protein
MTSNTPTIIGEVARAYIITGHSDEETLKVVKRTYPDSKTSLACIRYYRSQLRGEGHPVPTSSEARKIFRLPLATSPVSKLRAGGRGHG